MHWYQLNQAILCQESGLGPDLLNGGRRCEDPEKDKLGRPSRSTTVQYIRVNWFRCFGFSQRAVVRASAIRIRTYTISMIRPLLAS
jgi:hypothetical protein